MQPQRQWSFRWPPLTPWARALLIVIGVLFFVEVMIRLFVGFDAMRFHTLVVEPLGLSGVGLWTHGHYWQPLTYFWLTPLDNVLGIFLSLLTIYFFAPPIEMQLGGLRMWIAFITAGVVGGLVAAIVTYVFPHNPAIYDQILIGTQPATAGLIGTLCWWWKDEWLNLIVVRLRGWHVLAIFGGVILLQGLLQHPYHVIPEIVGLLVGMAIGQGWGPYAWFQQIRLRWLRRKIRTIRGGKDDRDWMN